MPLVFRAMKREADGLPRVADSATGLGARDPKDAHVIGEMVQVGPKGMSVNPTVADLPLELTPPRVNPAGWGVASIRVFQHGVGPFAAGLELLPDVPGHGVVRPVAVVSLAHYRADIVATRNDWIDTGL